MANTRTNSVVFCRLLGFLFVWLALSHFALFELLLFVCLIYWSFACLFLFCVCVCFFVVCCLFALRERKEGREGVI